MVIRQCVWSDITLFEFCPNFVAMISLSIQEAVVFGVGNHPVRISWLSELLAEQLASCFSCFCRDVFILLELEDLRTNL